MGNLNYLSWRKVSSSTGYHQHKQNNNNITSRPIFQSKQYNFPFLQVNLNIGISILSQLLQVWLVMLLILVYKCDDTMSTSGLCRRWTSIGGCDEKNKGKNLTQSMFLSRRNLNLIQSGCKKSCKICLATFWWRKTRNIDTWCLRYDNKDTHNHRFENIV